MNRRAYEIVDTLDRTPAALGIGRRVKPGQLDIIALIEGGGLTNKAEDGSAITIPVTVTHYTRAGQ